MARKTFIAAQRIRSLTGQDINWNTEDDNKRVRLNHRDYTQASGDTIGFSTRPNQTVTTTGEVKGAEFSPRVASGVGAATLVGLLASPRVQGDAGGNITARFAAIQAQLTDANAGTRTIEVAAMMDAWHQLAGTHTFTKGVVLINARTAGGGQGWTAFLRAEASGAGGLVVAADGMTADPETAQEAGYLTVRVDTTDYQIPIYAA
jgi:hypothetical protein